MSRRPGRVLELEPHHVYYHENAAGEVIYVGRTVDPDGRPTDAKKRPWIKTESVHVEVSPAMPFDIARWVEAHMICTLAPKHNDRPGQYTSTAERDWRIDRYCEAFDVTRATARAMVRYYPREREAFERDLATSIARTPMRMAPLSEKRQPGSCGLTADDVAEDRRVERDQARRVADREIARGNNWAAQRILEACDLPTGGLHVAYRPQFGSPDHALTVGVADRRIADAVRVLRTAELEGAANVYADAGTTAHKEWWRLYGAVTDRADEAMRTGLMGGAA